MDNERKILGFPDPMAPFEKKLSDEYGIQIGQYISSQWFNGDGLASGNCEFMVRRDYVRQKRLFVRGENAVKEFKQAYSQRDGALEMVNLNFKNINWAEKFCRIVSNGISDGNYKLSIQATDRYATLRKQDKKDYYTKYMVSKNLLQKAKKMGMPAYIPGDIPQDEQEIDFRVNIQDRPKIEIAEETLIDYVFKTNNWNWLEGQLKKDIVDVGIMIARVYLDKNDGVKLAYVDPEHYIHSQVDHSDFSDKFYEGVVDTLTISDIRRESCFDDETLIKIAKLHNKSLRDSWKNCTIDDIIDYKVDVLRFAFKTSKKMVFKKKTRKGETVKVGKRTEEWEGYGDSRLENVFDTWIEGNYILGSKFIYGYKECENLYDDVMNKAMSPFITIAHKIYENRLQSFATNIEEPARMLQKIHLKVQHLINELKPDGIAIDINQLAELDMGGDGGVKRETWQNALTLWETKGMAFVKVIDMGESGIKSGPAISPLAYQQGTALAPALTSWAHYYNQMREATGINPARDGSLPADALVGVNQLAQLASNTVTKDIVDCAVDFKTKLSEAISTRFHSIYTYKEAGHLQELYTNVLGKEMLDAVEVMKDRHLHEFGFVFEHYPTAEEITELKEDMSIAIQAGQIDVAVKYETYRLAKINIKLAAEYLKFEIKKNIQKQHEMEMERAANKSQNDAAAAAAKAQADTQAYSVKSNIDVDKAAKLSQIKIAEEQALQAIKAPMAEREFEQDVFLQKIKSAAEWDTKKYLEDRKDDRTGLQATQQSEILDQRNKNKAPIDFQNPTSWFSEAL